MFISEQRWIKVVAHVVRRLWDMDGNPNRHRSVPVGPSLKRPAATATPAPSPLPLQQPVWRPTGGGGGGIGIRGRRGGGGPAGGEEGQESFLGYTGSETTGWGSAASGVTGDIEGGLSGGDEGEFDDDGDGDDDDDDDALRTWEEEGGGRDWIGAGRSLAWAPPPGGGGKNNRLPNEADGFFRDGFGDGLGQGGERGRGAAAQARRQGRGDRRGGPGSAAVAAGTGGDKEGTRPAGMWEVIPPPHVAAMRRGRQARGEGGRRRSGGERPAGPAYLRGVQSRIAPQVGAHKERLRKVRA